MNTCKKCGSVDFYAAGQCKPCAKARAAKWKLENREKVREQSRLCYLANHDKEIDRHAKYRKENAEKLRISSAKYRAENADVIRQKSKEVSKKHYNKNRENCLAKAANFRSLNPEKVKESMVKWRLENPNADVEYRAKNKEKISAANTKWSSNNKDVRRIHRHNRRAREDMGKLSSDLAKRLIKLQHGKCACGCGELLNDDYHLDHIMPLALGGANEDLNIQLLTSLCNLKKGAKHPVDFMQSRGFLL